MTNNIASTLQECHSIVWKYREELKDVWPCPNPLDSVRFAVCEACEALDADLRLNGEYARNNDKALSVEDELCDCLMMLLTAVGKDSETMGDMFAVWSYYDPPTLDTIVVSAANILRVCGRRGYDRTWRERAWQAAADIVELVEGDVTARLTARMERIKAKRLPQDDMQQGYERYLLWARMDWQAHDVLTFDEWQAWANGAEAASVEPPPSVGLIYKREPSPDEIAYGLELETQLGQAGAHE